MKLPFLMLAAGALAVVAAPALAAPTTAQVVEAGQLIDTDSARLTALFKDIHQHPELGFMETRTAAIVAKELKALGFTVRGGIGGTGILAVLKNGNGPTVMYRADMDANAVEEATGLPYASKVRVKRADGSEVPVAHMCGHDAHVVWMLGMAKAMTAMRGQWRGTLVIVAQPAEELIAGARAMVDDGLYAKAGAPKPDYLIALHTSPAPLGTATAAAGPRLAGTDQIDILFRGRGGHGSTPQNAKDAVVMAAMAVVQYQTVISRMISPQDTAVLTVGSIQAGTDNNVIPDQALVKANLRWYRPDVRTQLIEGLTAISNGVARIYGMPEDQLPQITMKGSATPLVNDPALAARMATTFRTLLGEQATMTDLPPAMGSEDAHLLVAPYPEVPVSYHFVGVSDPAAFAAARAEGRQSPYLPHSPRYVVDLKAIPLGTKLASLAVLELLSNQTQ